MQDHRLWEVELDLEVCKGGSASKDQVRNASLELGTGVRFKRGVEAKRSQIRWRYG